MFSMVIIVFPAGVYSLNCRHWEKLANELGENHEMDVARRCGTNLFFRLWTIAFRFLQGLPKQQSRGRNEPTGIADGRKGQLVLRTGGKLSSGGAACQACAS